MTLLDSYFAADRQRRSRLEIKIIVMQAIVEGNHRQNHIMYQARLPVRMCSSILRSMEQQGLVETVLFSQQQQSDEAEGEVSNSTFSNKRKKNVKCYILTERGRRALDSYLTIVNALKAPVERLQEKSPGVYVSEGQKSLASTEERVQEVPSAAIEVRALARDPSAQKKS